MTTAYTGMPVDRVDGRAKVTGTAKYAGEFNVDGLAFGVPVTSPIARGKIARLDASAALAVPGVIRVFSHDDRPRAARSHRSYGDDVAPQGKPFRPLFNNEIQYSGQPVALVVAESFEAARHAATLVRVEYERGPHETDLYANLGHRHVSRERDGIDPPPDARGDADAALARSAVRVDAEYRCPVEHHNPMEPFATTAVYEKKGTLTVFDKTQGVQNVSRYLGKVFGLAQDEIRVVSPFVGGAFGSGLRPQYQVFLAVLAARALKRSVRVTLTRQQMFGFSHRPATWQRIALGASTDGTLEAVVHEAIAETSRHEDYTEEVVNWSGLLYRCDNVKLEQNVVGLDLPTPCDMRAPGAVWGVYALESGMDELADKLGVDPLELRLKNYAEEDQNEGRPFSSKKLRECYREAAERFGWSRRNREPRSMRDGDSLLGQGMATGVWGAMQLEAAARAVLTVDGKLAVSSATSDIGTGTYTIMTQIAAEALGLPIEDVTFTLGDSRLPEAPVEGGSFTAASVGSAVKAACEQVGETLFKFARKGKDSPLADLKFEDVEFIDRRIVSRREPTKFVPIAHAMRRGKVDVIEETATVKPRGKRKKFGTYTHSAIFAEVKVDEPLGKVRVSRVVIAVAAGRILNPKTARSQVLGGVVWGLGMALEEESVLDHAFGRFMTRNLADYHVAVNADVHDIDVIFVEEHDTIVNPIGAKGLGEIGVVGVAGAIANAVYHATGKRIRDLPITLDKLL